MSESNGDKPRIELNSVVPTTRLPTLPWRNIWWADDEMVEVAGLVVHPPAADEDKLGSSSFVVVGGREHVVKRLRAVNTSGTPSNTVPQGAKRGMTEQSLSPEARSRVLDSLVSQQDQLVGSVEQNDWTMVLRRGNNVCSTDQEEAVSGLKNN